MYEYEANEKCPYQDECRNACNAVKCDRCEENPYNYELMDKYGQGVVHTKNGRGFYVYRNNYDPM